MTAASGRSLPAGLSLVGRCAWCWAPFRWTWAEDAPPQTFCGKQHKERARVASKIRRESFAPGVCPNPGKRRYFTLSAAQGAIKESPTRHLAAMAYECSCGYFHVGHIRKKSTHE